MAWVGVDRPISIKKVGIGLVIIVSLIRLRMLRRAERAEGYSECSEIKKIPKWSEGIAMYAIGVGLLPDLGWGKSWGHRPAISSGLYNLSIKAIVSIPAACEVIVWV